MNDPWINLAYLGAAVLFIMGIKGLTHPRTAVRGNLLSALGMLVAIIAAAFAVDLSWWWVAAGLLIGGGIGTWAAVTVPMTDMPQMVAIFNGFGGGASVFVAWSELVKRGAAADLIDAAAGGVDVVVSSTANGVANGAAGDTGVLVATGLAGLIGAVTFSGSFVAFGKLQELAVFKNPWAIPGQQVVNAALVLLMLMLMAWVVVSEGSQGAYVVLVLFALVLGVTVTGPIGGADMPVVIAMLNSYSGLAAAATGFVISNTVLIITGSLVGASGLILTNIMCKAMNRSLVNVLFGKIDSGGTGALADEVYEGRIKSTGPEEIAMMLDGVQRVVIVPGYGMAVAQAQHAVRDFYQLLSDRGVNVEFAIHPVAGRMPGHMNVLLAEVDIPYDKLVEMERINPEFDRVDVAIVLGANDVVNPDARRADSPIAGMPILDVDKAQTVVVIKRSLSPGFAGLANPLFAADNTLMYFSDGKKAMVDLVAALKEN